MMIAKIIRILAKRSSIVFLLVMSLWVQSIYAESSYWDANLDFQIEGENEFTKTQIFVASQIHALIETNKYLERQKKQNYFCPTKELTTQEVFSDLKKSGLFKGYVKAEAITSYIAATLQKKYPCE